METVFSPSAKSWAMTAIATVMPTVLFTWKAKPMATPSVKLCAANATAEATPTRG
jgi:hypothetical protein